MMSFKFEIVNSLNEILIKPNFQHKQILVFLDVDLHFIIFKSIVYIEKEKQQ